MTFIFCTHNDHKLSEVAAILGAEHRFVSLKHIGYTKEIPEPYNTLEENSHTKAKTVYEEKRSAVFAEDTGLFVEAIGGLPGVKSARYSGEHASSTDNIEKLLSAMQGITNRQAYFKTVITLILDDVVHQFEGVSHGVISETVMGAHGFGYDPIFIPNGSTKSYAQMTLEEKNATSHRKKAFQAMSSFLATQNV